MWKRTRLLIWGKTYPEFSKRYYETVCTGAIHGETGRLIRIYPITLRYLDEHFRSYQWIEAEIERNTSDFRPESYKIKQNTITLGDFLDPQKKDGWKRRAEWILRPGNVFTSMEALREAERADRTSLGVIKPKSIKGFYARTRSPEDKEEWEQKRQLAITQKDLFVDTESKVGELEFRWVDYRVEFRCDDPACSTLHDCSILDWGIYVLDRNQERKKGSYKLAEADVLAKLQEIADPQKKDIHFFLGNTKDHSNNFSVVGLFYPPIERQGQLL
ncbi:MAG: hypothetical protein QM704_25400 [Anaeromyxobacteraceae bacterium]